MTRRLEDLKMLNVDRWKAQVDENRGSEGGDCDQLMGHGAQPSAPTGGSLFNLSNPTHDGEFVKPYVRQRDAQAERFRGEMMWIDPKTYQRVPMPAGGGKDWMTSRTAVPTSGDDFSSVALGSVHKYRIPPTSVTRKMGDCRLFGCCGWRLTSAQWIWCAFTHSNRSHAQTRAHAQTRPRFAGRWLNFVCFCVHTAMVFVTLWMAYWRHGRSAFTDTEHVMIPIYRIRGVPTRHMLDSNMSQWSAGWNLTSSDPNSGLFLYDNGMPVRARRATLSTLNTAPTHRPPLLRADQLCVAHLRLLRHLGRLPLLGNRGGRL